MFGFKGALLGMALVLPVSVLGEGDLAVVGLFKDQAVVRYEQALYTLKVGQRHESGLQLQAVESGGARITYQNETRLYPIVRDFSRGYQAPKQTLATLRMNELGQYVTPGSINGQGVSFQLDTGANVVALSQTEADRLGLDYLEAEQAVADTAQGRVNIWRLSLNKVKIGELELSNVQGAIVEGRYPTYILLGMSFLSRVKMQEDQGVITLVKKMQ